MDHLTKIRDNELSRIKESCVNGQTCKVPDEYKAFVSEWRESLAMGIDMHTKLTDRQRDFEVFTRMDELHRYHLSYLNSYYSSKEKLLALHGCAIFYLDETLSAYNKAGSPELLKRLKADGIRIGTNFSEKNVGVFVANIAQVPDEDLLPGGPGELSGDIFKVHLLCPVRFQDGAEVQVREPDIRAGRGVLQAHTRLGQFHT